MRHNVVGINRRIRVINVGRARGSAYANIRVFHGLLSRNHTNRGMNILLHNVGHRRVRHNRMLTGPNAVGPRAGFRSRICVLSGSRNNHRAPFFGNCHPRFCFHAASIANAVRLPRNMRVMVPNSGVGVIIALVRPVTVSSNLHFTVHRNNHAINTNIMTGILDWLPVAFSTVHAGETSFSTLFTHFHAEA